MKTNLLLLVLMLASAICGHGQTNNFFPATGYVGVGTNSPQYRLQMVGDHNNTTFNMHFPHTDPTKSADLTLWASEPGWTYTGTGIGNNVYNSEVAPAGIKRISSIKGGSNIRLLDGELRFNVVDASGLDLNAIYVNPIGNIGVGTFNANKRLAVAHSSGYGQVASFSSKAEDEIVAIGTESNGFSWIGTTSNHNFQIHANGDAKLTVLASGFVGIGTVSPSEKLAVNGNIRAKEIKVEAANWPDYVFRKDHKLRSLSEIEKHIKEKGHLPGIPSAKEVAASGIELGEMNKKLLEKIEELTLHLIEKEKTEADFQSQLNELRKEIKALKGERRRDAN